MMMPRILYVTADGVLQPLGHSQVVRVIEALAGRGFRYDLLSLEREADLSRPGAEEKLRAQLAASGIRWHVGRYDTSGGGRAAAQNGATLVSKTVQLARSGEFALIHARAFHGGVAARAARLASGVPFLFDARSYWIDERLDERRWFTNPLALGAGRLLERRVFADAQGVVTLTELQADDVRGGRFGAPGSKPIVCIPTCADYSEFQLGPRSDYRHVPAEIRAKLQGKLVLGFIGSLNRSYLAEESAALAAKVLARRPDAFILATSPQLKEYAALFDRHGIPKDRTWVQRVDHWAMPEWLSVVNWGLLLLGTTFSKRASMPTKLAEFFAAGVRIAQYGCNSEVSDWVARAGTGVVLSGTMAAHLDAAAEAIARNAPVDLAGARALTEPHFSLSSGIQRYERLLRPLR